MKLLIVDDDSSTRDSLRLAFTGQGFEVQTTADGEAGLEAARAGGLDAIVLDVTLSGRDGFSVLQALRTSGDRTPVLFLTARQGVEDRVHGLTLGADDYLGKPFAFEELLARVRSVLRRICPKRAEPSWRSADGATVRVGDLELDLLRNRAARAGRRLNLTPKEFALLSLLARRRGEVLTRPTIAEQVWDMAFDGGTNIVDVHVRRLRSKVDEPFERKLVHTIRGIGYVMEEKS